MKFTIDLSPVRSCPASACAYNTDDMCHAGAITVGDGLKPMCDTFMASATHPRTEQETGVGPCKVSACKHNTGYYCSADAIEMGEAGDAAQCLTFTT